MVDLDLACRSLLYVEAPILELKMPISGLHFHVLHKRNWGQGQGRQERVGSGWISISKAVPAIRNHAPRCLIENYRHMEKKGGHAVDTTTESIFGSIESYFQRGGKQRKTCRLFRDAGFRKSGIYSCV